jgi:hypothetical protein
MWGLFSARMGFVGSFREQSIIINAWRGLRITRRRKLLLTGAGLSFLRVAEGGCGVAMLFALAILGASAAHPGGHGCRGNVHHFSCLALGGALFRADGFRGRALRQNMEDDERNADEHCKASDNDQASRN